MLTRANVESILVRRIGKLLTAAGLDGTTISGANQDLSDPIGWAVLQLGGAVTSRVSVADSDVATVAAADEEALLDLSELRALESALTNYDATDIKVGDRSESLGQLGGRLEKAIERKRAQVRATYGIGLATLSAGVIPLGFQQRGLNET